MGKANSKLKPEVLTGDLLVDLRSNTDYSDAEIQEYYKEFLSDCPSGQLRYDDNPYRILIFRNNVIIYFIWKILITFYYILL